MEQLKKEVCVANKSLPSYGLVTFTWGNVSGFDVDSGHVVIKPSGVSYEDLTPEKMVVVNLSGEVVEGELKPSSDTATHVHMYQEFKGVTGIVHTHSPWATAWSQAGRELLPLGTTHADYFYGSVPCTRSLSSEEITADYELNTGRVIVETFRKHAIDELAVPGVLVNGHAPFTWGGSVKDAVKHAVVLEECAKIAFHSFQLNSKLTAVDQTLLDKHYLRKHGKDAYYGQ
ncbi:L-ribulose-5-phosphate 4-epimerase [Paenalkalicoccus suaedae]|uniref:L-ribulose-5-phosphate 4-epimerase n=1 Tax=Paenalkalicoccus suaedae TaxID=2592382 RepID=A0A859FKM9_9BACI|nr:L-ribulose-5-phosphate 4-epimerase [Paenalkalicoccus suaedae]